MSKQALVVDNNEFYRTVLQDLLLEEGYEVTVAEDGIAALRRVSGWVPDLVILDLVMPKLDGAKVCRQLRADPRFRDASILILSGILIEDMGNLQGIGADAYVAKMPLDRLLPTLRNVTRRLEEGCDETLVDGFEGLYRREVVVELLEEKRFRDLLFSSLGEGAVQLDLEGRIVTVNPAFLSIVERDELGVLDRPIGEILSMEAEQAEALLVGAGLEHGGVVSTAKLGERTVRLKLSPIRRDQETLGYMLLVEETSAIVQAEREKELLRRQLIQTEKLGALGQMVAGAAHELNNPLTGILGYTELCLERGADERIARDLRKVHEQARRCQEIVQHLLAFSRRAVPSCEPEDVNDVVRAVIDDLRSEFTSAGIVLDIELEPDLPAVPLDRVQWAQVIVQLLRNARQAIDRSTRTGRLRVATRLQDRRLILEVQDNGVGIPYDVLPRIFDPFFTTAGVGDGSGLGLSVAYGIVRQHQGRILVDGRPGEGARFTVEVPLAAEPVAESPALERTAPRTEPPRVLVVDDEPVIRDLLVDLLEARGARVETSDNGLDALKKLAKGNFDAVVLDLKMPEMGGKEVYERLREARPEMLPRVVFSTGDMVSEESRSFFQSVSAPVIQKPFQIDQVTQTLECFLQAAAG